MSKKNHKKKCPDCGTDYVPEERECEICGRQL